jgi:zinc transporter ZupT
MLLWWARFYAGTLLNKTSSICSMAWLMNRFDCRSVQGLNWTVHYFLGAASHSSDEGGGHCHDLPVPPQSPAPTRENSAAGGIDPYTVYPCIGCCNDPIRDLDEIHHMAEEMEEYEMTQHQAEDLEIPTENFGGNPRSKRAGDLEEGPRDRTGPVIPESEAETRKLMRMSVNTALAIGLHNFPEGLATFVAALDNPKVGAVLAVAIAIHNIPEGLCVAMPIYYATGDKVRAFGWGVFSGLAEPVAALLGWAVLANSFDDTIYAVLFGIVAGMMVMISFKELLPTAHRYDPKDTVVTFSFIFGMGIMALSLVLFKL